jgi:5-methylcytosine-specific restriction endonuclease McrA
MRDPRTSSRYQRTRRAWLNGYRGQPATCCMCGRPVDTTLPGTHRWGPTIEHRLPIRHIIASAQDWASAVALACDTSLWALAHQRCNSQQGQRATTQTNRARNKLRRGLRYAGTSRDW